jgi:hypothetical protein
MVHVEATYGRTARNSGGALTVRYWGEELWPSREQAPCCCCSGGGGDKHPTTQQRSNATLSKFSYELQISIRSLPQSQGESSSSTGWRTPPPPSGDMTNVLVGTPEDTNSEN